MPFSGLHAHAVADEIVIGDLDRIVNLGSLSLSDCTISGNSTDDPGSLVSETGLPQ